MMLYVMRPEEPPVCTAWMLVTAVPVREGTMLKGQQSLRAGARGQGHVLY